MTMMIQAQRYFSCQKAVQGAGPVVVKVGGSALVEPSALERLACELALLCESFDSVVLVHGGGPHINQNLKRLGVSPQFCGGFRVTDDDTLMVVFDTLQKINASIVEALKAKGVPASGLHAEPGLFSCKKKLAIDNGGKPVELGWVGEVEATDVSSLENYKDRVPVVSSIGWDSLWNRYNVNADSAALALAAALSAVSLIFVSDVPGVLEDAADRGSTIQALDGELIAKLIASGVVSGGMIPKLLNCVAAVESGVRQIAIVDGAEECAVLKAAFGVKGCGTFIASKKEDLFSFQQADFSPVLFRVSA